jgi:hypothetical protein
VLGDERRPTNSPANIQTDDPRAGDHSTQGGRDLDAVRHRDAEVHDYQSGGALFGFLDGSVPSVSPAAGFERRDPVDEVANGAAHRGAVIDDEDSRRPGDSMAEETTSVFYSRQYEFSSFFACCALAVA